MLSLPHLIVIFVVALVIFGPEKLPELARMLGKATAEFRRMTNDFRYALEGEVRDLERQTRLRDEEVASALRPVLPAQPAPEGAVQRVIPAGDAPALSGTNQPPHADAEPAHLLTQEPVSASHEKSSDDNPAV